jgi:RecG-like helicase
MHCNDKLKDILPRLNDAHEKALTRLGVITIRDLLYHFPARYADITKVSTIAELVAGETATIVARVIKAETKKAWKKKIPMAEVLLEDTTGQIKALWFHQAYMAKMLHVGTTVTLTGRPTESTRGLYLANAEFDKGTTLPVDSHESLFNEKGAEGAHLPVYPETRGITSRFIHHALIKVINGGVLEHEVDPIPVDILERYHLPSWKTAMHWLHLPRRAEDATIARKRFAFEEVFYMQLVKAEDRALLASLPAHTVTVNKNTVATFTRRFPFKLTDAQTHAIESIFKDFHGSRPMSRLLEGDVGSGKTAVAAVTAFAAATSTPGEKDFGNLQVAYMAPTEILATQHFESFIELFRDIPVAIGLLTGKTARKFPSKTNPGGWTDVSRAQLLKWVANGEIPILIGTHTLIQKTVKFKHLAYVVIDEQHRFGVRQRMNLVRRTQLTPHTKKDVAPASPTLSRDALYQIERIISTTFRAHTFSTLKDALPLAFEKEKVSVQHTTTWTVGRGKTAKTFHADFIIGGSVAIIFRNYPLARMSDKADYERILKASPYMHGFVIAPSPKGVKIIALKNPLSKPKTDSPALAPEMPVPHLLSMTATPIPRTLALTIYGDLDLTVLDQAPSGRLPIKTEIVAPNKREDVYEKIRAELVNGRQAYIICPRIDEPDPDKEMALIAKSVTAEAARLKKDIFPEYTLGVLHSKMSKEKKEEVMQEFSRHTIDILVATSVVEVGVNVPNATNIIIEGAERFGLSQLHQLRGRVMRSTHQPYCYLFTESGGEVARERLTALKNAKNGFELAELDLKLRGSGELAVGKQWGISDLAMEAIKNPKMVEAARTEATRLVEENLLKDFPLLKKAVESRASELHFE